MTLAIRRACLLLLFVSATVAGQDAVLVTDVIPASETGTGFVEVIQYQLGSLYDPDGPPHPLVVAYHGYGASAASAANNSTVDEECDLRGMVYMAPTGIDDQLFGSPISQQNVEAAIDYMVDQFHIDEDRIYMVGMSMGAGIVGNFAARHRDPDGIMIAALGLVEGMFDWTQLYNTGSAGLAAWLENPYNFNGPPTTFLFDYQQASVLYFDEATYPPFPGTLVPKLSMATNLHDIPVFMTWGDENDAQHEVLSELLIDLGANVVTVPVADPLVSAWDVLDEQQLFDFFEGQVVDRTPAVFQAQSDLGGPISWLDLTQRTTGEFSWVDGAAADGSSSLAVTAVENATDVVVDAAEAGVTGVGPFSLVAESADVDGFDLRLEGFALEPSYVIDEATGLLVPGVASDPLREALIVPIESQSMLEATVVADPTWTTDHDSTPNPVAPGETATITIDAPDTSTETWWILGFSELLTPLKGGFKITVSIVGPSFFTKLPLDPNGDLAFPLSIPDDAGLSGAVLLMQCLTTNAAGDFDSVSNLWRLEIE